MNSLVLLRIPFLLIVITMMFIRDGVAQDGNPNGRDVYFFSSGYLTSPSQPPVVSQPTPSNIGHSAGHAHSSAPVTVSVSSSQAYRWDNHPWLTPKAPNSAPVIVQSPQPSRVSGPSPEDIARQKAQLEAERAQQDRILQENERRRQDELLRRREAEAELARQRSSQSSGQDSDRAERIQKLKIEAQERAERAKAMRESMREKFCFPGDTPVRVKNDSDMGHHLQPISTIRVGDFVLSCALTKSGVCEFAQVLKVKKHVAHRLITFSFAGRKIRATENHPFYLAAREDWIDARDLTLGDHLLSSSGESWEIESKESEEGEFTVYNLKVSGNSNYYACDVLVHNCDMAAQTNGGTAAIHSLSKSLDSRQELIDRVEREQGPIEAQRVYQEQFREVLSKDAPLSVHRAVEFETKVLRSAGTGMWNAAPDSIEKGAINKGLDTVNEGVKKFKNAEKLGKFLEAIGAMRNENTESEHK